MSPGYAAIILVTYVLASASVTRLINTDKILNPLRLLIVRREHVAAAAAEEAEMNSQPVISAQHASRAGRWAKVFAFVICPWCVSFWVALPAAVPVVQLLNWSYWAVIPLALAARYVIGRIAPDEVIEVVTK